MSKMALYPSGLRGRSAKPLFIGSNPIGASKRILTPVGIFCFKWLSRYIPRTSTDELGTLDNRYENWKSSNIPGLKGKVCNPALAGRIRPVEAGQVGASINPVLIIKRGFFMQIFQNFIICLWTNRRVFKESYHYIY